MDDKGKFALIKISMNRLWYSLPRALIALGQLHPNSEAVELAASSKSEQQETHHGEGQCGEHEQNGAKSAIRSFLAA
jgi:hypothetical protein